MQSQCHGVTDNIGYKELDVWVGYYMTVPICVLALFLTSNVVMVLNYVYASLDCLAVEASSLGNAPGQTGVVICSPEELNDQGLSQGAFLYSSAPNDC